MRRSALILCACVIPSCTALPNLPSPAGTPARPSPATGAVIAPPEPKAPPLLTPEPSPRPPQERLPLAYHRSSRHGVTLALVSYDDRDHQLRVADQPGGPGSRWQNAQAAAATYHGLAAINGGFFTPKGKPLGLLIETGTRRGAINRSSLGAAMLVSSSTGSAIIRRKHYPSSSTAAHASNLLQTGPMLAEKGKPIPGLLATTRRPRSFVAWDGKHHWAIGYAEPCTLDALSRALAGTSPAGFRISTAVNLDGGRSSDLWAGPHVDRGNKTHRSFLNKVVRNYLVLIPR